jgi:hypothetical protein
LFDQLYQRQEEEVVKEVRQEDDDAKVMMYIIEQIPFYQFLHGLLLFYIVSSAELI